MTVLLEGVVGSRAYGLETPDSDIDTLGIFAYDTRDLVGLELLPQTRVRKAPDITLHEAAKFCRLTLKCNPTVMELLWLPEYTITTQLGRELIGIRKRFLSRDMVRRSYLGYATQQFRLLERRDLAADPGRREKHARHLRRLLYQGTYLHLRGTLPIRVDNPEVYREFGRRVAAGDLELARRELAWAEGAFDTIVSPLPPEPDVNVVGRWLQRVREAQWSR